MSPHDILALPMLCDNDAGAKTVKEYLKALLSAVWSEGEGFSGKRPFGNSGWDHELYDPLIRAGLVSGKPCDGRYDIDASARKLADELIASAIEAL
jgi:hypothetical protein